MIATAITIVNLPLRYFDRDHESRPQTNANQTQRVSDREEDGHVADDIRPGLHGDQTHLLGPLPGQLPWHLPRSAFAFFRVTVGVGVVVDVSRRQQGLAADENPGEQHQEQDFSYCGPFYPLVIET